MYDMSNDFIKKATITLQDATSTMQERGEQYTDTWGKSGCWHLTKSVIKKFTDMNVDDEICKAVALAAFVDQKYSRFAGGYKHDTAVDLIPYIGALAEHIKQLEKH